MVIEGDGDRDSAATTCALSTRVSMGATGDELLPLLAALVLGVAVSGEGSVGDGATGSFSFA